MFPRILSNLHYIYQVGENNFTENLSADFTAEVSQVTPASMADSYQSISDMMPLDSYSTQSSSNSQVADNNFLTDFSSVKNKTGNGLKSKNSNKRQEFVQHGSYADDDFIPKRLKLETNIMSTVFCQCSLRLTIHVIHGSRTFEMFCKRLMRIVIWWAGCMLS